MDGVYALEPEPHLPDLPGEVVVRGTFEDLLDPLAVDLMVHAMTCVRKFGDFHLAVSSGPAQLALALRLMVDPAYRGLPWPRTHLWFITDRSGPHQSDGDIAKLLAIVDHHAGIPAEQLHAFPPGPDRASAYAAAFQEALAWRERGHDRLDYALLALGADGGPVGAALHDGEGVAVETRGRPGDDPGVTLTLRVINAARMIAVIAAGDHVRPALSRMTSGDLGPFAVLQPVGGGVRWYLDRAACPAAEPPPAGRKEPRDHRAQ